MKIREMREVISSNSIERRDMPSPTKEEMDSDEFNAIWDIIKQWDINVPDYYNGYAGGNGSHVKLILDSLKPILRNNKINTILE